VNLDELRKYCAAATEIPGTGHNAHVEAPASIVALAERLACEAQ
jgi:pimeloyl-ACP methyl ester carboxylesterase